MDLEDNIRKAFQGVKKDILEIKDQLLHIAERQERLEAHMEDTKTITSTSNNSTDSLVQITEPNKKKAAKKPVKKTSKKKK